MAILFYFSFDQKEVGQLNKLYVDESDISFLEEENQGALLTFNGDIHNIKPEVLFDMDYTKTSLALETFDFSFDAQSTHNLNVNMH